MDAAEKTAAAFNWISLKMKSVIEGKNTDLVLSFYHWCHWYTSCSVSTYEKVWMFWRAAGGEQEHVLARKWYILHVQFIVLCDSICLLACTHLCTNTYIYTSIHTCTNVFMFSSICMNEKMAWLHTLLKKDTFRLHITGEVGVVISTPQMTCISICTMYTIYLKVQLSVTQLLPLFPYHLYFLTRKEFSWLSFVLQTLLLIINGIGGWFYRWGCQQEQVKMQFYDGFLSEVLQALAPHIYPSPNSCRI